MLELVLCWFRVRLEREVGNGVKGGGNGGVFIFRVGDAGAAVNTRDLFSLPEIRDGDLIMGADEKSDSCELGAWCTRRSSWYA